jgi:hypothetical protein
MIQQFTQGRFAVGVDRYLPSLLRNRSLCRYSALVNGDILDLPVSAGSFDAVVALDVIEHFEKEAGYRLLDTMERTARRRVIVYTPNGFVPQTATDNPWQQHLSGWTIGDFVARGYTVSGAYGWKRLRGEESRLLWRPRWFWEFISCFSQGVVSFNPGLGFGLCAVKELNRP